MFFAPDPFFMRDFLFEGFRLLDQSLVLSIHYILILKRFFEVYVVWVLDISSSV